MPATYKDIRRLTGLSLSTISKYYNGGNVKPETKRLIEDVSSSLDFRINDFARGLKSRKSMTVGLIIPRFDSLFYMIIVRHVGHFLRMHGYSCMVCESDIGRNAEKEAINFLIDKMADGIIAVPFNPGGRHLELARARGIPVVLMDRIATSFESDSVLVDNFAAGRMAAELFISRGHRNAAIICGPEYAYTMSQRRKGFMDTYSRLAPDTCGQVIDTFFSIEDAYNATKKFLVRENRVSAIFCANYELTVGAYAAMNELGLKYPEDISFIGFDNVQLTKVMKPKATLIEQPMEKIAYAAADLLLKRLGGSGEFEYETVILETKLIEGDSVADLR